MPLFLLLLTVLHNPDTGASPEAAHRHNSRGIEKLQSGDYTGAIQELRTAHRYLPADPRIRKNLGIAYNNYAFYLKGKGDLRNAVRQYNNSLQYDSENPYAHYNIGQAYYLLQDMARAEAHLEKAYSLDPALGEVRELLERVRSEGAVEAGFDRIETMHFIIAADRSVPGAKISYIRTHLEEAYGRVGMLLRHYPRQKTVAVIFSEDKYDQMLGGMPHWALAVYDGKVRIPADRFKYTRNDVRKIIYHEYAHAVVRDITGGNCPVWLNEGIAGFAESLVEPVDKAMIRRYLNRFGIIPFRNFPTDLSGIKNREVMTLLYMESYLLVEFIVRRTGYDGLSGILNALGTGIDIWTAMTGVTGQSMADFERDWERYLSGEYGWKEKHYL